MNNEIKIANGAFKNFKYAYDEQVKSYKYVKWMLPVRIISEVLLAIISIFIPTIVVLMLTTQNNIWEYVIYMCLLIIGVILIRCISNYSEKWMNESNSWVRFINFAEKLIGKSLNTDYVNVEKNDMQVSMKKGAHALSGYNAGFQLILNSFSACIVGAIGMLLYGCTIISLDIRILVVLIGMSVSNVLLNRYARNYMENRLEEDSKNKKILDYLFEKTTDIEAGKDIRIYSMYDWIKTKLYDSGKKGEQWQSSVEKRWFLPKASDILFTMIRDLIAYGILIKAVCNGEMSLARFTFFLGVVAGFTTWLVKFINAISDIQKASMHIDDYRYMVEYPDKENDSKIEFVSNTIPEIEFKDVCFQYNSDAKKILDHVSFRITPGEKIAIVGNNGAGKTTLIKLLCGFYQPTSGTILFDGVDASKYSNKERYKFFSTAFQDVNILAFNIAQNISGCEMKETDEEKVRESLKLAGLQEKVDSLKDGANTYITQKLSDEGILLSGGESQKLIIARALYKNAPVFLLDEPTSAMDPIAEMKLYSLYEKIIGLKTAFFISHRLASTQFCDRIMLLEGGKIIEEGSHTELINKKGKYAELYDVQSAYYKESEG